MEYCAFRLEVGGFENGEFDRKLIMVQGQMNCPWSNRKHLNWETLRKFSGIKMAMRYLAKKVDETGKIGYLPGGTGYRSAKELHDNIGRICDWYTRSYERGRTGIV